MNLRRKDNVKIYEIFYVRDCYDELVRYIKMTAVNSDQERAQIATLDTLCEFLMKGEKL